MDLICGINPVLEALAAGTRHFDRLLIVKGLRNQRVSEAIARASQQGIPLRFEARETLDRMAGGLSHQGIMAVVSAKPVISMETLLAEARDPALIVVLDGVEDPRNLGAIVRTAEAAGADGVVLPERHSAGLSETVSRASAGGLEHVKVARIGNVAQALDEMKSRGVWVVGFDATGTERWDAVDYRRPVALVLGGEGRGMRRLVRERCDHLASLPLFGHVGSLNVSVAAGVALYEVIRQRGTVPSHVRPIPSRPSGRGHHVVGPGPEDREHDPGSRGRSHADVDPPDGEEGGDDAPRFIRIDDEEAAWSGRPEILKGSSFRSVHTGPPHGPHRRRGRRFRKGQGRHQGQGPHQGQARHPGQPRPETPSPPGPPPSAEGHPPMEGPARRRRRRRGRRDHPSPAPPAQGQPEPAAPAPHHDAPGPHNGPPGGPPRHRRRGRRRRH
jgi:23S rRNA (guanosine2251-2'-O)-methyltransferase